MLVSKSLSYLPVETLFAMFHRHADVQKDRMTRIVLENL